MKSTKKLVNLTVNPCKMCMPMGVVSALYGIRGCMSILHGSQGCATYIRRHMATHYNEPVDVASSSLTEQGTVFGGEANLLKGIDNLISLYHPEVVAVATTCLAETIGEDVPAMLQKYRDSHPDSSVKLISVSSAGYGGTQNEGFFRALRSVVEQVEMDKTPNNTINIVTPLLSPADTRFLKHLLDETGLSYTLLPDLSENLDGAHEAVYDRLPKGGTPLSALSRMAGARATLELSITVDDAHSPAQYLLDAHGVPLRRMALPMGLGATDEFLYALEELGGHITESIKKERGRLLDGMIDAHKYNGMARAAVFGEPDFVAAMVKLLSETGVFVPVVATGSATSRLRGLVEEDMKKAAALRLESEYSIRDDCDFEAIEELCTTHRVNLLVGSSDARRIAHRLGIDLLRCAFPIHDRVGGQRVRLLGYDGMLNVLEQSANAMLANKEETFREELTERYYRPLVAHASEQAAIQPTATLSSEEREAAIRQKTLSHPCFTCGSKTARMHLPVAPKCNIQCNYCVRSFDCPNESRPGVTTQVLSPEQAAEKFALVKQKVPNLTVIGIAGPGDALANFMQTRKTLQLIRAIDPSVTFCLSTNGLLLPLYAQELIDLSVTHVTVTVNAVDPELGARIYKHVDYMGTRYFGVAAASMLLANQLAGIRYLAERGIVVKVNTVVLKGLNEEHIEKVVRQVKELGAAMTNIMQLIPVTGSAFACMEQVSMKRIDEIRDACAKTLPQMRHCRQCRADAIGTLDNDVSIEFRGCGGDSTAAKPTESPSLRFAVATKSGMVVDLHFGHAEEFHIYSSDGKTTRLLEKRSVERYCAGPTECDEQEGKIERIIKTVADCNAVLALRTGDSPTKKLQEKGIAVITTYDRVEEAVVSAARQLLHAQATQKNAG